MTLRQLPQTAKLPSGFVRTRAKTGSLSPWAFLDLISTSYSVSGLKSTKPHAVSGVSNPQLQLPAFASLIRTTYV